MEIPQFYFTVAAISILGTFLVTAAVMINEMKTRFDGLLESLEETENEDRNGERFPEYVPAKMEEYYDRFIVGPAADALHLTLLFSGRETGKQRAIRLLSTGFDKSAGNLIIRMLESAKNADQFKHLWQLVDGTDRPEEIKEVLRGAISPKAYFELEQWRPLK